MAGETAEQDRGFDRLGWHEVLYEKDKVLLFQEYETVYPVYPDFTDKFLTSRDQNGLDFLIGDDVRLIRREAPRATVGDVLEGRCRGFVRVDFDDPYENWTPLRPDCLAAAIVRNVRYARPDRRLGRRLATEAGKCTRLVADFLAGERTRFEEAWVGGVDGNDDRP